MSNKSTKNYKENYYKALEWKPGDKGVNNVALNMPEELKRPVISKIVSEQNGDLNTKNHLV